jgi:LacI family transcriptional regulator
VLTNSDGNLAKERRNIRNLAARQVDGVVLASVLFEPDLADLETAEIPSVLLSHSGSSAGVTTVGVDLAKGARTAVEHLIGHGHTNIGLAMGTTTGNEADAPRRGLGAGA